MADPEKTKKRSTDTMEGKSLDTHILTRDRKKAEFVEKRKDLSKYIKQQMNRMTLGAREGSDIPSLRQKRFEKHVDKMLEKHQKETLDHIDEMFASYNSRESYSKFLTRVRDYAEGRHKNLVRLQQAILYTIRCVAGYNGKIERGDYAYFYTILDNISELYGKNVKIGETIVRIQKEMISKKDWDDICRNIKSKSLKRTVPSGKDQIKLNTSAFLVQLMKPHQRVKLILEFNKRYKDKHAMELAEQMVQTGAISLKQYQYAMTKITGAEYVQTRQEENFIRERRRQAEMLTKRIRDNIGRPLAINPAERFLNRSTLGALAVTGIGVLGMITNYMAGLSTGKGIGKYFKGLKSPYFLLSAGVTAGGYHWLTGAMHPGKSVGALDKIIPKPKRLENPFGVTGMAEQQDYQMKVLASICADHPVIENWLLRQRGFDSIRKFYYKKRFENIKKKSKLLTAKQKAELKNKKKDNLVQELIDDMKKKGDHKGAASLKQAVNLYGEATVEQMVFKISVAADVLGITSTAGFYRKKTQTNVKYNDLFLYRQGVKPRPTGMPVKTKTKTKKT